MATPTVSSTARRPDLARLLLLLAISAVVAGVSGAVTVSNVQAWYAGLVKPPFDPPNGVFGPVWTILYIAMAVAAWRIWRQRRSGSVSLEIRLYAAQMVFNFAWSLIFFGMHRIGAALVDILMLLSLLAATTIAFWRRDRIAGLFMVPYLAWVAFATVLNFTIWRLN